jgi:hypothetical protein
MVNFQTKNAIWVIFAMGDVGTVYGNLVYFTAI